MDYSKIKTRLQNDKLSKIVDDAFGRWIRPFLYWISPLLLTKYRYRLLQGKRLNIKNPQSFDEKLIWLNLYWRHPLKVQCTDKYAVRSYVIDNGFGDNLPELIGVYDRVEDIDFSSLPQQFVLKVTHGCKFNIFCKDKQKLDVRHAKKKLDNWMNSNISKIWGEIHYKKIKPRIICETFLDDGTGNLPSDYKVFCFKGKAFCTMVCSERSENSTGKFDYYDRDWENKLPFHKNESIDDRNIPKPKTYDEIIEIAEKLSIHFPFVRMDFYDIHGKAVFGEMTFTPSGCIDPDFTDEAQRILGDMTILPEKLLE